MDSELKSGKEIRTIYNNSENVQLSEDCIIIGIRHFGDYRKKRRRDFIPPSNRNNENLMFAKCEDFYKFLNDTIITELKGKYRFNLRGSIFCGHSFGGVFGLFVLLEESSTFDNYVILSPSTWVNHKSIFEYEKRFASSQNNNIENTVLITLGGLEVFNKVYFNSKKFVKVLTSRNYNGLILDSRTYVFSTHNSYVKKGLRDSFATIFSKQNN